MTPPTAAPPTPNDSLRPPAGGPKLRVTIGAGTAAQKTWVLRRPVTLIGSRRKCQIHLPHPEVGKAHCVIVNTGADILLCDLVSPTGTFVNGERVDLVPLCDGDVIRVGPTQIQVAIRCDLRENQDTEVGLIFRDPTAMPVPVTLRQANGGQRWPISRSVAFIGRHQRADVCLDHADISLAHTLVFHLADRLAVFDLGSRTGTWVNGKEQVGVEVGSGTLLRAGPFELVIETDVQPPQEVEHAGSPHAQVAEADQRPPDPDAGGGSPGDYPKPSKESPPTAATPPGAPDAGLDDLGSKIVSLHREISQSWDRLESWEKELDERDLRLTEKAEALEQARQEIARQQVTLDAQNAQLQRRLEEMEKQQAEALGRRQNHADQAALEQRVPEASAGEETLKTPVSEMARAEAHLDERRRQLEEEHRREQARLQAQAGELDSRTQALAERERTCRDLEQRLNEGEQFLRQRSSTLDQREAELERLAVELAEREAAVERLRKLAEAVAGTLPSRPNPRASENAPSHRQADDGPSGCDPAPADGPDSALDGPLVAAGAAPKKRSWWRR